MREENGEAAGGAVQVDIGVLLGLASKAGIQLDNVVAMTGARLTSGLSPAGISPTTGPAPGVAISRSPPTTVMCAQALSAGVAPVQQPASGQTDVLQPMVWGAESQVAQGVPEF
jgi:hypothetical protein